MKNTVVITGANRGIGLSLSKYYKTLGCAVYAICRQPSPELQALDVNILDGIDVSDDVAVKQLKTALHHVHIDLLINNAGILRNETLGDISYDSIRQQFEVNALAPLKITEALRQQLSSRAKVAVITSRMGSIEDNTSGGRYGYRMSKAALNIAAVSLAHDLKPQGVVVAIIHPGLVGTDMIGGHGDITPDVAAERIAHRIEVLTLKNTGIFWHSNGDHLPW